MRTQVDTLVYNVNRIVEDNVHNVDTLINQKVVVGYIGIFLLGLITFTLTVVVGYFLYIVLKDKIGDIIRYIKYKRMDTIYRTLFNELTDNVEFDEWITRKRYRKYEIRNKVKEYVDGRYVDGVTEYVWKYHK